MTTRVPIRYGGTGANTAATARAALGAAPFAAFDSANLAYGQANNAYSAANLSYGQANAAYGQANSAYGQANLAYTQANNAYGQANLAYTQANNAYGQANLAFTAANNAKVTVFANNGSNVTTQNVNFVNTATVTVLVTQDGSNANVEFVAAPQTVVNDTVTAAGNTAAAATANVANAIYGVATNAYDQANNAYNAANNSNLTLGGVITGTLNVTQDLIIGGNIYLEGNTTFINVSTYAVEDALIFLASNNYLTDSVDIGFIGGKNTGGSFSHTGFARDASDAKWKLFDNLPDEAHQNNVINFANATYATLVANLEANSILLTGNTVATNVWVTDAYNQANAAFNAANNARVTVFANNSSNVTTQNINFVNTSTVTVVVTQNGSNANVSFDAAPQTVVNDTFTAAGNTAAAATANIANAIYGVATAAFAQANNAANTVRISQNSAGTLSARQLNFVNTGNIKITMTDSGGNANLAFDATITRTNTSIVHQTFTSANGSANLSYQLIYTPWQTEFVFLNRNGIWLSPFSEYTLSGNTVTIIPAGEGGDTIDIRYFVDVSTIPPSNTVIVIDANTVTSQTSTFFLSENVATINRLAVSKNGLRLTPGTHYTLSGNNTVNLTAPAQVNDQLLFEYFRDLGTDQARLGFNRDSFVGNGSNTDFVLSNAPANEDNCLVFVDRVLQRNSEYNVASSMLTFNAAPDANAVIDVFVTTVSTINANNAVLKTGDTITGNLFVNALITSQNIVPSTNNIYDLGSNTRRFKDLWLSNTTIYLGDAVINSIGNNISFGNATINTSTANISTIVAGGALTLSTGTASNGNIIFSANGTEDMRILTNGNVGIGTATPATTLDALGSFSLGTSARSGFTRNTTSGLYAYQTNTNDSFEIGVMVGGSAGPGGANANSRFGFYSDSTQIGTYNAIPLTFLTNGSERARIDSSGNVGIGVTNPFSRLQVGSHTFSGANGVFSDDRAGITVHGSLTSIMYASTYNNANFPDYGLVFVHGANTSNYNVWSLSPDGPAKGNSLNFIYGANATNIHTTTPRVVFRGDGNVGIGTTNPGARLQINASRTSSTNAIALLLSDDVTGVQTNGVWKSIRSISNGGSSISEIRFIETDGTNNNTGLGFVTATNASTLTERMRINNAGNVGIGTTNPSGRLHVEDGSLLVGDISGGSTSTPSGFRIQLDNSFAAGTTSTSYFPKIVMHEASNWQGGFGISDSHVDYFSGAHHRWFTGTNPSTPTRGTERLKIWDSGFITTPSQPFAVVSRDSNLSSAGTIVFGTVFENVGNYYNAGTGAFTCPVAGVYLVSLMLMTNGDQTLDIELRVNGASSQRFVPYQAGTGGFYNQVSGMTLITCAANDALTLHLNSGSLYGQANGRHGCVVFRLLG